MKTSQPIGQSRSTRSAAPSPATLRRAYRLMRAAHGHQRWWPGETPFEICVGAILTQNTAWKNVERAIAALRSANRLGPLPMFELETAELAALIRPAGCGTVKARRLHAFLAVLVRDFDARIERFLEGPTPTVRQRLLAISGIGPETADCMLLYAGGHLSFVVDAYTRRIFARHGWVEPDIGYHELQSLCADALGSETTPDPLDLWQDYHAQLVAVGKDHCRARDARCASCPLRPLLPGAVPFLLTTSQAAPRAGVRRN